MGNDVHFGALSRDDELVIKYYVHLPILLHDINSNVDRSRALIVKKIDQNEKYKMVRKAKIVRPVFGGEISDFKTDGGAIVLSDKY